VATGSTKSRNRKTREDRTKPLTKSAAESAPPEPAISETGWLIATASIMAIGAILRLYKLDLVPLHHDEGVNGNFLVRLVREGYYHYDPANYHGPTLYYLSALWPWLMRIFGGASAQDKYGLTTTAIRFVPALFGIATIALIFTLRRKLGTVATLSAAFLLAVSPGAVYLSRYFIHETLFTFFTFGIVVAITKYYDTAELSYLLLAAVSAAMLFATKETAIISVAVLVIALGVTIFYQRMWGSRRSKKRVKNDESAAPFMERVGSQGRLWLSILAAVLVFLAINLLFYSSFFTNFPQGVYDAFKTFQFWTKTGKENHVHPIATYAWWLLEQESPLLTLGLLGGMLPLIRKVKPYALFVVLWAFGLFAAYSLISYKTPWLALNFILPLALVSGSAMQWIYTALAKQDVSRRVRWAIVVGVLVISIGPAAGLARLFDEYAHAVLMGGLSDNTSPFREGVHWKTFIPGFQTFDLNFRNYDNDDRYYVYVYAHTRRDTLKLVDDINRLAERTHQAGETGITIVSPDYWPLPWYLRDYKRVGYHGQMTVSNEPIIIAKSNQAAEVEANYGDRYQQVKSGLNPEGTFSLRPGVDLLLYARRELLP